MTLWSKLAWVLRYLFTKYDTVLIHQMLLAEERKDGLAFILNESMSVHSDRRWIGKTLQQTNVSSCYKLPHDLSAAPDWCCNIWHKQSLSLSVILHLSLVSSTKTWLFISMFIPSLRSQLMFLSSCHLIPVYYRSHLSFSFSSSLCCQNLSTFSHTLVLLMPCSACFYCFLSFCRHMLSSTHLATIQQNACPLHPMPLFILSPAPPWSVISSPPSITPNTFFLSSIHLWSHSSSALSTSDPSFPHFPTLWSLCSPELWGTSLCVSCLCRSLHVWWPQGRDDTDPLEWEGTESGRSSTNALLNPLQYTMSSS